MRKTILAAIAALILTFGTSCGYIGQEQPTETTTTTELTIPTMPTQESSLTMPLMTSETKPTTTKSESELKKEAMDTFLAEFYSSKITLEDTSSLVKEVVKTTPLEHKEESKSGKQIVTVKGKNGSGSIELMRIDLTKSGLDYDVEYLLTTMGEHFFDKTISAVKGVNKKDFNTSYKMSNIIVSKGKYQQYASAQKTDGTANQFGYAESYAVVADNKLTVVTGHFVSTDINERQNFCKLLDGFRGKVKI
ncbi:MAG: hypothetical protein J5956_03960 [Ruminococcus sp.]|nr:hypothetical protein [Ruminococcus sp.]